MTDVDRTALRPAEGTIIRPVRLLAMGDLVPENGFSRLLEIFAGVVRWNRRARLIIVGDGPERDALEDKIAALHLAQYVGLPGRARIPYLAEWMQRAHVFVSAPIAARGRLAEGLPVAMAGGLCIVATELDGAERILEDGATALLAAPDDEAGLSRALHLAVANASLRRRLGEAAAASVRGDSLRRSA